VTSADDQPAVRDFPGPVVRIGRNPESDLVFPDAVNQVSWDHARLDLSPDGAYLQDLGSTNGTYSNEDSVRNRSTVFAGDVIRLGQTGPVLHVMALDLSRKGA